MKNLKSIMVSLLAVAVLAAVPLVFTGCDSSKDYDKGYNAGYSAGETAGQNSGYDDGYDNGYAEGKDYGAAQTKTAIIATKVEITVMGYNGVAIPAALESLYIDMFGLTTGLTSPYATLVDFPNQGPDFYSGDDTTRVTLIATGAPAAFNGVFTPSFFNFSGKDSVDLYFNFYLSYACNGDLSSGKSAGSGQKVPVSTTATPKKFLVCSPDNFFSIYATVTFAEVEI